MKNKIIFFKGIRFYDHDFKSIINILKYGGYLVAPAASSLSKIYLDRHYYQSLRFSKIAILDSGFFCILLFFFKKIKIRKFSGYLFLKNFIKKVKKKNIKILSVDPNLNESRINKKFFIQKKIKSIHYLAPYYENNFKDLRLLKLIKRIRPNYILINIRGEKQERLAYEIYKNNKKIPIICTGAAIGFLTSEGYINSSQAPINDFIDKYYMGWLFRLLHSPIAHIKRFNDSLKLIKLFY